MAQYTHMKAKRSKRKSNRIHRYAQVTFSMSIFSNSYFFSFTYERCLVHCNSPQLTCPFLYIRTKFNTFSTYTPHTYISWYFAHWFLVSFFHYLFLICLKHTNALGSVHTRPIFTWMHTQIYIKPSKINIFYVHRGRCVPFFRSIRK